MSDDAFTPGSVRILVGETVVWSRASGSTNAHNVREDGKLFRNGEPTTGPIDFGVVFSSGTFRYRCEVHGTANGGMDGFIRVPVKVQPPPDGLNFTVRWAKPHTETGQLYDVQYRVGTSGNWQTWRSNTRDFFAVFGAEGKPISVKNNTTYQLRARSGRGSTNSLWSPPVPFTP